MEQINKKVTQDNTQLNTDVSSVFVVQNSKRRPFIEQFEHTSVNFTQKELGTVLGFFIVRDESLASENIVNFLASEVKKCYFGPSEKSIEDKFESTLHRVNRALEEIANIGNVEWLGTVEGAVCAIDDSAIYFSVTGDAQILLLRDDNLINISEGLASEEAAIHPLKTFVDISNGDINPHDKIIIASQELFDLVSFEELQKNAVRMGEKNFVQFIETVLTNECVVASATIVDVKEEELTQIQTSPQQIQRKDPEQNNYFDASTFEQEGALSEDISSELEDVAQQEIPREYTDPRTGHIHIQGDDEEIEGPTVFESVSEKFADVSEVFQNTTKKHRRNITKKLKNIRKNKEATQPDLPHEDTTDFAESPTTTSLISRVGKIDYKKYFSTIWTFFQKIFDKILDFAAAIYVKIKNRKKAKSVDFEEYTEAPRASSGTAFEKARNILPDLSHISNAWRNMSTQTKMMALGIVLFVVIIPLVFSSFSRKEQEKSTPTIEQETVADSELEPTPPAQKQSQNTISDPEKIHESDNIIFSTYLKEIPITIESDAIIVHNNPETVEYPTESSFGKIVHAAAMDDLNMIFFITDENKLYSFSPVAKKYSEQPNAPSLDHTKILSAGTYLTYLYTLTDAGKVLRYTRIDGGFDGEKSSFTDPIKDFKNEPAQMIINDDIYITQSNTFHKFYKGKDQNYSPSSDIKKPQILYATEETEFVWILDTENTTLYKTKKDSSDIEDQFTHSDFSAAKSLAVDEKNNTAIITTENTTIQFSL